MIRAMLLAFALLPLMTMAALADAAPATADRIFVNGRIWTGDEARPAAQALAVRGGRLLAVGTDAEVRKLAGTATPVVDLAGLRVVPGFYDGHMHVMGGSLGLDEVDLVGTRSVAEVQERLAEYAKANPGKAWIVGGGWAYGELGEAPTRARLDAVVSDRPVLLADRDHHSSWVNSKALALAGVGSETKDPADGIVVRDAAGAPTGLLKEGAVDLVATHVPPPTPEETQRALRKGMALLASYGLTSVQDALFSEANVPVFERLLQDGGFKVRVRAALPLVREPDAAVLERYRALRARHAKDDRLRFEAVKSMLDGVIDAKTASMLEPYTSGGLGLPNWTDADLDRAIAVFDREGFQVMLHACGDRAIRQALDAFERVGRTGAPRERRHRVEHAEVPTDADRSRFKALGVVASTQALFANPDKTTLENYAVLLGPARTSRANAFKRFDDAGAVQAFGSDWPVFSAEVLRGIYCAVTRVTPEGTPPGGFYPESRISVEAALRHFTAGSAYAAFEENEKGTLAADKLADFVVLSEDILAGPPERILKARVVLTVMGGEETYRSPR